MKALLVGGSGDIRRDIEKHAQAVGISVGDHWTRHHRRVRRSSVPKAADVVLAVWDMLGQAQSDAVRAVAEVSAIKIERKWSRARQLLWFFHDRVRLPNPQAQ